MARKDRLFLRLPRAALARRDAVVRLAEDEASRSNFALKCDELGFARALLERRSNYWLYRTSQRAFAGDFLLVDVSSPRLAARPVFAVELKRGERVRNVGTSSIQLQNTHDVVAALAADGVVDAAARAIGVQGDARAVLDYFTPRRPRRARGP